MEIVEDGQAAGAEHAFRTVIRNILLPLRGVAQGIEQLCQILHMLLAIFKAGGENVGLLIAGRIGPEVLLGKRTHAHPVGILLTLGTKRGAYAYPVFLDMVIVCTLDHIAKTVIGGMRERAVLSALFHRTVDNLGKVRDGGDLHLYLRPGRGTIHLGVGKRAYLRVAPGVSGRLLGDGVYIHQVCKALGGRSGRVTLHDTGLGVRCVRNANHRLKGFAFVVRGVV